MLLPVGRAHQGAVLHGVDGQRLVQPGPVDPQEQPAPAVGHVLGLERCREPDPLAAIVLGGDRLAERPEAADRLDDRAQAGHRLSLEGVLGQAELIVVGGGPGLPPVLQSHRHHLLLPPSMVLLTGGTLPGQRAGIRPYPSAAGVLGNARGRGASRPTEVLSLSAAAAFAIPTAAWAAEALPAVESESASPGLGHRGLLGHRPYRLLLSGP